MPYKNKEAVRHHIPKQHYKVANWAEYNQALRNRGRIDIWISDEITATWSNNDRIYDGTGSTQLYPDTTILVFHEIRSIFRLPLRQTEGLINSWFARGGLSLKCPDYSLMGKRLKTLNIKTPRYKKHHQADEDIAAIAIDSTGLKRYGRDEWHQEKHKIAGKRSWRKMHLAVGDDHVLYAAEMTDKDTPDSQVVDALCQQIQVPVSQVSGDKAYDENAVYRKLEGHFPKADIVIPPKKNLTYDEEAHHPARCKTMLEISEKGQAAWQTNHHYGKRAIAELAMQRFKRTFGNQLHARKMSNQKQEMMIACGVLNRFTGLGMPQSYRSI